MKRRFAWQVVGVGVVASGIGGAAAAWVSGGMARAMVENNENARLLLVAESFAEEIQEELEEPPWDDSPEEHEHFRKVHGDRTLGNIVVHELEELRYPEPRATVRYPNSNQHGSPGLPMPPIGTCLADHERHFRACSVRFYEGTMTLAIGTKLASSRTELFRKGIITGAALGGIVGGLLSFILGRWTLVPLLDLRRRVRQVRVENPTDEVLQSTGSYPEELEELRAAISDLVARLREALLQAQSFATHAAHELRTPLTALSGELELLIEDTQNPHELSRMKEQLDRLKTLIQRILVLASSEGSLAQTGQAIESADLIRASLQGLPSAFKERIHFELREDLVLRGDEELLRVLIRNAVENALKFSSPEVSVRTRRVEERVWLEVKDSGPGIPKEDRERVFDPFYRSQAARGAGIKGHGIGLALIAHVARIHGGSAHFVDRAEGSLLRIDLPLWKSNL